MPVSSQDNINPCCTNDEVIAHWLSRNISYVKSDELCTHVHSLELDGAGLSRIAIATWWSQGVQWYALVTNQIHNRIIDNLLYELREARYPIIRLDLELSFKDSRLTEKISEINKALVLLEGRN